MHRSRDGLAWSAPVDAAISQTAELAYDKQWLTCDNGAVEPVPRPLLPGVHRPRPSGEVFALQRSDDGGLTWSPPVTSPVNVTGVIPVVQPNGRLVISSWSQPARTIVALTLGRRRPDPERPRAGQRRSDPKRTAIPRAAAHRGGARSWRRHPRRSGRTAASARPARRTTSSCRARPTASHGRRPAASHRAGTRSCRQSASIRRADGWRSLYYSSVRDGVDVELVTSADGVRWSAPQRLNARRMPFEWMPQTTLGRMLADYIGVTWSRGRPRRRLRARLAAAERQAADRRSTRPTADRWRRPATGRQGARRSSARGSCAIAHGLCSSALPWTTRLTLSAASRSSSACLAVGAGDVERVHVHVAGEDRRELVAEAGEDVDDAAGHVRGRDRLGELDRGERLRLRGERRRPRCRRRAPARAARRGRRAPAPRARGSRRRRSAREP